MIHFLLTVLALLFVGIVAGVVLYNIRHPEEHEDEEGWRE